MRTVVVEAADALVVPMATIKQHLRLDDDDTTQDVILDVMARAATATIDGPDGWLGRALGSQVLELQAERFPCAERGFDNSVVAFDAWCNAVTDGLGLDVDAPSSLFAQAVVLACPPIAAVTSITYRDVDGTVRTLDPAAYVLFDRVLMPVAGTGWPSTHDGAGAVAIRYRAGYSIAGGPGVIATPQLPAQVTAAILLMVSTLYENRGVSTDDIGGGTVERVLQPLRIY